MSKKRALAQTEPTAPHVGPRKRGYAKVPGTLCTNCDAVKRAKSRTLCKGCYAASAKKVRHAREKLARDAAAVMKADRNKAAAAVTAAAAFAAEAEQRKEAEALRAAGKARVTRSVLPCVSEKKEEERAAKGGKELFYDDALKAAGQPQSRAVAKVGRRGFVAAALQGIHPAKFGLHAATSACLLALICVGVGMPMSAYAADTYALQGKQRQTSSSNKTAKRIHFGSIKRYNNTVLLPKYTLYVLEYSTRTRREWIERIQVDWS
jgi:predicted  nucleic acid-binding Zn-ribbon protein